MFIKHLFAPVHLVDFSKNDSQNTLRRIIIVEISV